VFKHFDGEKLEHNTHVSKDAGMHLYSKFFSLIVLIYDLRVQQDDRWVWPGSRCCRVVSETTNRSAVPRMAGIPGGVVYYFIIIIIIIIIFMLA
jgi:hypothetical protein